MTYIFKENIDKEELKEIVFKFEDKSEIHFSLCHESWEQFHTVNGYLMTSEFNDKLLKFLQKNLFKKEKKQK